METQVVFSMWFNYFILGTQYFSVMYNFMTAFTLSHFIIDLETLRNECISRIEFKIDNKYRKKYIKLFKSFFFLILHSSENKMYLYS